MKVIRGAIKDGGRDGMRLIHPSIQPEYPGKARGLTPNNDIIIFLSRATRSSDRVGVYFIVTGVRV